MESNKNEKIKFINTDCSPSHLFNNLSISDRSIVYIHNSEIQPRVIVIDKKLLLEKSVNNLSNYVSKLNSGETNEMVISKCLHLNNNYYVGVGLYGGFKLWSMDGNRLLFQIPCKVKLSDKPYVFTCIHEYKSNFKSYIYDSILCGDNYGQIFLVSGSGQNWRAKLLTSYENLSTTAICSGLNTNFICVGFETGEIHIYNFKNDNLVESVAKFDNILNLPCLTISLIENNNKTYLVSGYLNGEIKLHDISPNSNFNLLINLGAHMRMINHIATYKNYFASAADDCFVNLWKIDDEEKVTICGNYELNDKMPVGVVFNENGQNVDLIAGCYDFTSIVHIDNLNI